MKQEKIQRRLRPLYAAQFLQGFVLWYAIEKVFMQSIGFTGATIALETVLFTVVMLIANIPLGVLADRWSRKGVLVLSSVALIASSLICGLSNGFWVYAVGGICWGLFYAGYAGTYDSIVYDTLLEETGGTGSYEHYYGRVQLFDSVALVLGSLLSSLVVHLWGLRTTYFITIVPSVLSIFALAAFREPTLHRKHTAELIGTHVKATFTAIGQRGKVLWIVVGMTLIGATMRIVLELDQLWLLAVALPVTWYGPVNALVLSGFGASGPVAARARRSKPGMMVVGLAMCTAAISLLFRDRTLIIGAQVVMVTSLIALNIMLGRLLHDTMPSNIRAGASSVVTTLGYLLFLPLGLLFGQVSTRVSVFRAAWIVVALTCMAFASLLVVLRARQTPAGVEEEA